MNVGCVCVYLVNVRVPVFIMSGLGIGAVDAGEECRLGEVHLRVVQPKRFSNQSLNATSYIPDLGRNKNVERNVYHMSPQQLWL